jgi:hypothetical protein
MMIKREVFTKCLTHACPAWHLAAEIYLSKLEYLRSKVLRTSGDFSKSAPIREPYVAFSIPCVRV